MNSNQMEARLSGAYVHWNPKPAIAADLRDRLKAVGYDQQAPCARTAEESLRLAMQDRGAQLTRGAGKGNGVRHRYIVQAKLDKTVDGFELVDLTQTPSGQVNVSTMVFTAVVKEEVVTVVETGLDYYRLIGISDYVLADRLQEAFSLYRALASGSAVGNSLVKLVQLLNGVAIKEDGGLYYLPDGTTDEWEQIAQAFEASGKTTVGCALIQLTERTARDIHAGISRELEAGATELLDELMTNDCSQRQIKHRLAKCQQYRQKARYYEGIVGATLDSVRKVLDRVDRFQAAAQAIQDDDVVFA